MVGNDWHEAKQAWTEQEWPNRRDIPRPAKQSVKSEMPPWKQELIWGKRWQEPNDDPEQQDHFASTSFDSTHLSEEDGW